MSKVGDMLRRGMLAPFRALLPKNPWLRVLVIALPIVMVSVPIVIDPPVATVVVSASGAALAVAVTCARANSLTTIS